MHFSPDDFTAEQINILHLNSDKDSSAGALHHTLGLGPTQASPGNHRHNGRDSYRIRIGDIAADDGDTTYQPIGGTDGTQPTFSGDPLITGSYVRFGPLCHFQIDVDFDNVTNFGSGQYYLTLPFNSEHAALVRDGCLHDISSGIQYHISGHVNAGSNQLMLFTTDRQGNRIYDFPFEQGEPVTLTVADNFHIAGTYHIQH